ncbi:hypothetical protein L5515_010561 [Caenorhabditis briggsae]|uniref:Uncharacterized protein n=1 Tax=Caenorhabditis briggsae TaxID=6238 RepID=A0AAE9JG00_CAEBR|nr:hypothetical protein L5515_010561 [Caenorhabditis briggsae]
MLKVYLDEREEGVREEDFKKHVEEQSEVFKTSLFFVDFYPEKPTNMSFRIETRFIQVKLLILVKIGWTIIFNSTPERSQVFITNATACSCQGDR